MLSEVIANGSHLSVPNYSSWISLTGREKEYGEIQPKVEFMPLIEVSVTENATPQHINRAFKGIIIISC